MLQREHRSCYIDVPTIVCRLEGYCLSAYQFRGFYMQCVLFKLMAKICSTRCEDMSCHTDPYEIGVYRLMPPLAFTVCSSQPHLDSAQPHSQSAPQSLCI